MATTRVFFFFLQNLNFGFFFITHTRIHFQIEVLFRKAAKAPISRTLCAEFESVFGTLHYTGGPKQSENSIRVFGRGFFFLRFLADNFVYARNCKPLPLLRSIDCIFIIIIFLIIRIPSWRTAVINNTQFIRSSINHSKRITRTEHTTKPP